MQQDDSVVWAGASRGIEQRVQLAVVTWNLKGVHRGRVGFVGGWVSSNGGQLSMQRNREEG